MRFPDIDPAIHLGPLDIHWYGVMYLLGFIAGWYLGVVRAKKRGSGWLPDDITDLVLFVAIGVIAGGRLGYVLFYGLNQALADPLWIIRLNEGGMSFHGGLIGVLLAMWLFARRRGRNFWDVTDFLAPLVPLGILFGRIGNFINGELWGEPTSLPWGIIFPDAGPLPRHPSMLYEGLLEGLVLFLILWFFSARRRPRYAVSALFLLCYGIFRFLIEFVRIPDAQLGYLAFGWLTMGQILTIPMIVIGIWLLRHAYAHPTFAPSVRPGSEESDDAEAPAGETATLSADTAESVDKADDRSADSDMPADEADTDEPADDSATSAGDSKDHAR